MHAITRGSKLFFGRCLLIAGLALPYPTIASQPARPLLLADAVSIAIENSPALAAYAAKREALQTRPEQARSLADPMLSINAMNLPTDTFDLDQEPMTQLQLGLSQALPFPGKRDLRESIARLAVDESSSERQELQDQLIRAVRQSWWQVFSAHKALAIIKTNKALLRDFIEVARAKYAVGKGLQQDVLLAELELSRLMDRELSLMGKHNGAMATLRGLLSLPAGAPIHMPEDTGEMGLPGIVGAQQLVKQALGERKLLDMHRHRIRQADTRIDLADHDRYPDFRVGVGYAFRNGSDPLKGSRSDFLSVMFSMNLPIYSRTKQSRQLAQREAEKKQQVHLMDDALRQITADIDRLVADYESAKRQTALLRDTIIPKASQTVESMLAGYQVNKVDFLNVINGQLMLYNAQIRYWNSLGQAKRALANLAAVTGMESIYE